MIFIVLAAVFICRCTEGRMGPEAERRILEYVESESNRESFVPCVTDRGDCDEDGRGIKANVISSLKTGCPECDDVSKLLVTKIITHIIKKHPKYWEEMVSHNDPERFFAVKLEKLANPTFEPTGIIVGF